MSDIQNTKIGPIPRDWQIMPLNKISRIVDCEHNTAPFLKTPTDWISLRTTNIREGFFVLSEVRYITQEIYNEWTRRGKPQTGDVILTMEAPVGMAAVVPENFKVALGNRMVKITPKKIIKSKFLMYCLLSQGIQRYMRKRSKGTTARKLNVAEIRKIPIPIPSLSEQNRIIEILDTVAEIIQITKSNIDHYTLVKKGIMNRILSRGIGHTKFKQTKIEETPESWDVTPLSKIADILMGQSPPSSTYNQEGRGLPFFQGNQDFGERSPIIRTYCTQPFRISEQNDILISVRAPVGDVNLCSVKCAIGRGLSAIRPKKINVEFLFQYLKSCSRYWRKMEQGSTFKAVNKRDLERLLVPLPSIEEQKKIAGILQVSDESIASERLTKKTFEHLKKGLMQVLLTGKVRVKV